MKYKIDNIQFEYEPDGDRHVGENVILLNSAVDLIRDMPWHRDGFTVETLLKDERHNDFINETRKLLINKWQSSGLHVKENFQLHQYHTLPEDQSQHIRAIDLTKLIDVKDFPLGIALLEDRISNILQHQVKAHNPYDHQEVFHFRIIRPKSYDNNPLHRDVWLEDYKDCVNLYIPITGSNKNSSLIIAKGSHLWPESKVERTTNGSKINNQKFNVPAVTDIFEDASFVRPDPQPGEVLIFSPYLIHGGAVNLNEDKTRISIEIRLWKK